MSNQSSNRRCLKNPYNFNDIKIQYKNQEQNVIGSQGSTRNIRNKNSLFKQMSFSNNNLKKIERNHSSVNIPHIKKYSKFRINKNEKPEKNIISKCVTSKLLIILKNSERSKVLKKDSINEANKKTEIELEQKKLRHDNFGNIINKKNKKIVHIIFKDQLTQNSFTEEIQIESFKKYNFIEELKKVEENNPNKNPFNKCCLIY